MKRIIVMAMAAALLAGCGVRTYTPVIDLANSPGKNQGIMEAELAECRALAAQRMSGAQQGAVAGGIGAVIGAGLGAAIYAIVGGDVGEGLAAGAVMGGASGAAHGAAGGVMSQQEIVVNCMRARGYAVVGR